MTATRRSAGSSNGSTIQGDPDRVVVGGQSAGGNLTAASTLMSRNEGRADDIAYQVLVYPGTDFVNEYESMTENDEGYYLSTETSEWYHRQYLKHDLDARRTLRRCWRRTWADCRLPRS